MSNFPSDWPVKTLIECTKNRQISYGIVQPGTFVESGVPIIRVNNFQDGTINTRDLLRVDPEISKKHKKTILNGGEVLLTIVGTTGLTAIAPKSFSGFNVARAVAVIDPIEEIGATWIEILLHSDHAKNFLNVRANTTVQKTLNLKDVRELPIPLPRKNIKNKIEAIYSSLNQKISINLKTNFTLTEIAQAIFKSWFIDFDPVYAKKNALEAGLSDEQAERAAMGVIAGLCDFNDYTENPTKIEEELEERLKAIGKEEARELEHLAFLFPSKFEKDECGITPKNWCYEKVSNVADVIGGGTPSTKVEEYYIASGEGIPWLSPKDLSGYCWKFISRGATDITELGLKKSSARMMPKGAVVISSRAPIGYIAVAENDVATNQGFKSLIPKENINTEYLYYWAKANKAQMESVASGSTFKEISGTNMKNLNILVPPKEILDAFQKALSPMSDQQVNLRHENKVLTELRDTLLPRLLSGEISLDNISAKNNEAHQVKEEAAI